MRRKELWIFLFFLGALALNWPLLAIFGSHLPTYLFTIWISLIAAIFLFVNNSGKEEDGG